MSEIEIPISVKCGKCGGTLEAPDSPTRRSTVSCVKCGKVVGQLGNVRSAALNYGRNEATDAVHTALKRAVKGNKYISFK